MLQTKTQQLRDLWLPALVSLSGVLIALACWGLLISERREQLLQTTRETAAETSDAVELALRQEIETLRGLSERWSRFGLEPLAEWTVDTDQPVDRIPGLISVAWVDADGMLARITAGTGRLTEELDSKEILRRRDVPQLVGPERDASGSPTYRVFLPLKTPEEEAGMLVAEFHIESVLEDVVRARALGYALSFFWEGEQVYARGTPSEDPWQRWWRAEEEVALPVGGGAWRLVHRPTPEYAAARLTPVPHYLLAAAILLAIVLGITAHELRVIVRQSRYLAASNRALEERGRELESKVAERTEELQEANAELEAFNYSVSHDLRSPLGAILNFSAILEEDYRERSLDADGLEVLRRIRRSASRAIALLEDLMAMSRAGRAPVALERIDMTELALETFAQDGATEADVEFLVESLPEATGDRALLADVFTNLFSNALKYSRDCQERRVTVTGRVDNGECIYEVTDNGRGFDMRFAGKLFGLFERLHSREDIEGTGVGLAMVARIVKRHGGRVWAEGKPGEGARFSFAIPRKEVP